MKLMKRFSCVIMDEAPVKLRPLMVSHWVQTGPDAVWTQTLRIRCGGQKQNLRALLRATTEENQSQDFPHLAAAKAQPQSCVKSFFCWTSCGASQIRLSQVGYRRRCLFTVACLRDPRCYQTSLSLVTVQQRPVWRRPWRAPRRRLWPGEDLLKPSTEEEERMKSPNFVWNPETSGWSSINTAPKWSLPNPEGKSRAERTILQ